MQLHLEGRPLSVIVRALTIYRDELKKARKKDEVMGLPVAEHHEHDKIALDLLEQLGFSPKSGGDKAEVTAAELGQLPLPINHATVQCLTCSRNFRVPAGITLRACPDCGQVHKIKADEDGTLYERKPMVLVPPDIRALMVRKASDDADPLTPSEERALEVWLKANPNFIESDAPIEAGARVADPEVVGSGNPLRIDCTSITGKECEGFDSTDTPGHALCPRCGQKYVVEVNDGALLLRLFDPTKD